jgi:hypothetical protein
VLRYAGDGDAPAFQMDKE